MDLCIVVPVYFYDWLTDGKYLYSCKWKRKKKKKKKRKSFLQKKITHFVKVRLRVCFKFVLGHVLNENWLGKLDYFYTHKNQKYKFYFILHAHVTTTLVEIKIYNKEFNHKDVCKRFEECVCVYQRVRKPVCLLEDL